MRIDVHPSEVMRQSFWLGAVLDGREPHMHRLADCIALIRPRIVHAARGYDDRSLIWALTAITVHLAIEADEAELAAAMFRSDARLLELAGDTGPASDRRRTGR
ncbi:MAG: hypothetical protein RLO51_13210 [Thalassobaculum sp.]|uniref:hypothetical protein n=1 Tax=Thalassobaculum sp. TaxID=2022740 RepID=UPI0032EB60A1